MRSIYVYILMVLMVPVFGLAQSGQYKRSEPKAQKSSKKDAASKKDGKVDIKELEEQYWTPTDTEFKVVQNRKYTKEGRLGLTLQFGIQGNDPYTESFGSPSMILGYYWSEFLGAELIYTSFMDEKSEVIDRFESQFGGTTPEFAILDTYIGANFNWVPFYGKMSILDSNIIYFDLAISPGLGITSYEPQVKDSVSSQVDTEDAFTLALDISQHFFFDEHWGIRLDMKNRAYQEERFDYSDASSKGKTDRVVTFWQLGFTYYFDAMNLGKANKKDKEKDKKE